MSTINKLKEIANIDILVEARKDSYFIGRPFYIDYDRAHVLVADDWKHKVNGIPQGTLLLAFYDNDNDVSEALLLRALKLTKLPTDNDVISSMIEYYKDNLKTAGKESQLDQLTRYEFSFSGLECRVLGTFYKLKINEKTVLEFGADVENFYSSNNYSVYKATGEVLMQIVNQRDGDDLAGNPNEFKIGSIRYSSSRRFEGENDTKVNVFINPKDFLGKRTALFGMTRTGKSNTVKKIIEATVEISSKARYDIEKKDSNTEIATEAKQELFNESGAPKYPVGQIIFDINGEYANPNMQDDGTAIYELYKDKVTRYSVLPKDEFKVLKVNFYQDIPAGFELVKSYLSDETSNYIKSFLTIDLEKPDDKDKSALTRWERKKAAYLCSLYEAKLTIPENFKIKFEGNIELNKLVKDDGSLDPSKGITLEQAKNWFNVIWENYNTHSFFTNYRRTHDGREWADEDLKALLVFLTRKMTPGGNANVSGYRVLRSIQELHTETIDISFEEDILKRLREGKIVIIDLSQGDPKIQALYSEKICRSIFINSMARFIKNKPNNFIQFYFEEAHNLFPKKDDKDLSQIYNRIAKEGAKLGLGMIYATQEVSSISSNILKNTQNWFIAHLNNEDELKEIKKYYDFEDFTNSLGAIQIVAYLWYLERRTQKLYLP